MAHESEFLAYLKGQKGLTTANRPLRIRLAHPSGILDDALLPQKAIGTAGICDGLQVELWCLATNPNLPLKEFIALPCALDMVTDRGELHTVCGIVSEASAGDSDGGVATYKLVMRDAMAVMEKRTNTRLFRNSNEIEIVQLLLDEWRASNRVMAATFALETSACVRIKDYPKRETIMQMNESDAAFVRRLLARRGIGWYFRSGPKREPNARLSGSDGPMHTMVLFNRPASLDMASCGTVRYHRDGATEERDTVTTWAGLRTLQSGSVTRHSWDYKNPRGANFMFADASGGNDQGVYGNELAASLNDFQVEMPHVADDHADFCDLGCVRVERHDYEAKCFHGEGSVRDFCVGQYFTLAGHPEIDTHALNERDFVITRLKFSAQNNLPTALAARVEQLFRRNRWVDGHASGDAAASVDTGPVRTHVSFTAVRRGIRIVPAYDARRDLPPAPIQVAIVVGPKDEEVFCDRHGRVRIRFPGMRAEDHAHAKGAGASDSERDSAWVRVASGWAGNGGGSLHQCGMLGLPRVGTEVLVMFMGGDPDKPIIIGQLYNGIAHPPALSDRGELPGNRYLAGIKSREVRGNRSNRLRFDDTTGRISAQLASDHGMSELNLGFLTQPISNGHGEARGEGAELRSDHAVAVRGAQGVLISADAGGGVHGPQLERGELVRLADGMSKLADQLSKLAAQHALDAAGGVELAQLIDKVRQLHRGSNVEPSGAGGEPIVAVTGPAGVVMASAQNVAVGAHAHVDMVSGGDTRLSAAGSTFVRAAHSLSLFAHQDGMKLTAASGKVQAQAQDDGMELLAKKVLDIISTTDWINLKAKQGVRINGGGSELVISADGIQGYTSGKSHMYAADHQTFGPKSVPVQFAGFKLCPSLSGDAAQSGRASTPLD